ncbi:acyl carrier protein [Mycobacterium sp. 852002-40037_SCH5390672]|uniref:acyl carrier protein n=1 Tax=Mycobacterium sp. 852002-40037_SCH5390672 TaxID=1834089 RepID=UPI000805B6C1|nr:acyl carrier protein [Mycobacterium sp. 852002-40037_SCH5390672]OBB94638.1 hypothetical protein A5782_08980 [Mycobacterium sp. 852002-40037_SCH5390672]
MDDTSAFVRDTIASYLKIPVTHVTPEKNLDELGMDSLGALEMILTCEEKYGFSLNLDSEEVEIITVADAIGYVSKRVMAATDTA